MAGPEGVELGEKVKGMTMMPVTEQVSSASDVATPPFSFEFVFQGGSKSSEAEGQKQLGLQWFG